MKNKLLTIICLIAFQHSFAQSGTLDSAFGYNGIAQHLSSMTEGCFDGLILPNGKLILVGAAKINFSLSDDFCVLRLDSNGNTDNTFGTMGKTRLDLGNSGEIAYTVKLQSDGKIVLSGFRFANNNTAFAVARFTSNGLVDTSFSNDGYTYTSIFSGSGYSDIAYSMDIQQDGKIVLGGKHYFNTTNATSFALIRYNTDGTIDSTFNTDGKVITPSNGYLNSLTIQPDGKIVAVGQSLPSFTDFVIVRYKTNGSLDSTFNSTGVIISDFGLNATMYAEDVILQPDGKILAAGYYQLTNGSYGLIARYNTDGTIDSTFALNGISTTQSINLYCGFRSIKLQPDGKILAGGGINDSITGGDFILMRFLSTGIIDSTFGINGIIETTYPSLSGYSDLLETVLLQPDYKIVGIGQMYGYYTAVRYLNDLNVGLIDFSNPKKSTLVFPNPVKNESTLMYDLVNDESITIFLYDLNGRIVETFISNVRQHKGNHKEVLHFNETLSAGNYLLQITNGKAQQSIKIVKE